MIWFFDREGARIRYEIKHRPDGDGYELVLTHPDGRIQLEHIAEPNRLLERCAELGATLKDDGWHAG